MPKQPLDSKSQERLAHMNEALNLGLNSMPNTGRRIMTGALLGTCLAFIVASLAVPHLDLPLEIALGLFVFDIPLLVVGFMLLLQDLPTELEGDNTLKERVIVGFSAVHTVSFFPVVVGFGFVLWHFGPVYLVLLVVGVATFLGYPFFFQGPISALWLNAIRSGRWRQSSRTIKYRKLLH
jgi:hypothetical protein